MHAFSSYYSFSLETVDVCEYREKKPPIEFIIISVIGITLNSLLLYLIKRYSNSNIGNYKYLLAIFALFDIFLSSIHGLCNPVHSQNPSNCSKVHHIQVVFLMKNTFAAALYAPWQSHVSIFEYCNSRDMLFSGTDIRLFGLLHRSICAHEHSLLI